MKLLFKVGRMTRCSDAQVEPLPGTAKQTTTYVVFEWPYGWSRDVLDGNTFSPELSAQLKALDVGIQLIKHPRERRVEKYRCFVVFAEFGVTELHYLDGPEQILDLDLTRPTGNAIDYPLVLVCTHGKRDVCCAVKGRPLAVELHDRFPGLVWETSHTKGHRFAPSVLLMPWGYSFGRLNVEAATAMLEAARRGEYFCPANRGSGLLTPPDQVREVEVARRLLDAGETVRYTDLTVEDGVVKHRDGREWNIPVEEVVVDNVISSCGDDPKQGKAFIVA